MKKKNKNNMMEEECSYTRLSYIHSSNVIKFIPKLTGTTLNARSPVNFWLMFITPEIIGLLVEHIISMMALQKEKYAQPYRTKNTDTFEMKALIVLFMLTDTYPATYT